MIRRALWPLGVAVVTLLYAAIPLLGSREFYNRGDSAVQFGPTWYHLGKLLREGQWPPTLDPDVFAGGNYSVEALFGIYNPVNWGIWLYVSSVPDLLVSLTTVKMVVLMVLALGIYFLCREYKAAPWAAAVVALAVPFAGFTIYFDAASWPSGLISFAYCPWVWRAFRRTLSGNGHALTAVVVGALAVLHGNPYSTLMVAVVGVSTIVEGLLRREYAAVARLCGVGVCVAAFLPLVYFPLIATAEFASRSTGDLVANAGVMRPDLGDLFMFGSPTFVPDISAAPRVMRAPLTYFAWFVLPLLPWLRYGHLYANRRLYAGVAAFTVSYLLLALAPSQLWLFRWPARHVEFLWLGVGVALAITLTQGIATDLKRRRWALSGLLVLATCYLNAAEHPEWLRSALVGPALILVLGLVLLLVLHRGGRPMALVAVTVLGTGLVMATQTRVFPENDTSRLWHTPHDIPAMTEHFSDLDGRVLQVADPRPLQKPHRDPELRATWDAFLPGSLYQVTGVDAMNSYTGMGMRPYERRLCMHYEGFMRPCGYKRLWQPLEPGQPRLAELLKIDTVVASVKIAGPAAPKPGFRVASRGPGNRFVLERTSAQQWPDSSLSWASPGISVAEATSLGEGAERVQVTASRAGELVFAQLAWPGFTATLDGEELPLEHNRAGLITVPLAQGSEGELALEFTPPGRKAGLAAGAAGLLGGLLLQAAGMLRRRRAQDEA